MVKRLFAPRKFGEILDERRGIGPGFDFVRIGLAFLIFYFHARMLSGRADVSALQGMARTLDGGWEGWKRPILVSFVPSFFALSGFLVSASAMRTRATSTFLAHRALRIFPALVVEVVLSAFVLGLALTTLPVGEYLTDPQLYRYLGNIFGSVTFHLPGLFEANPVPGIVNANLWTLPSEFDCYLLTAGLMLTGVFYRRSLMTTIILVADAVFIVLNYTSDFAVTPSMLAGHTITFYFFIGVLFYHWRDYIPYSWPVLIVSGAITYFTQMQHHMVYVAPVFLVYCTIFVGLTNIPVPKLFKSGDYSYGIYLYGYPITQFAVSEIPGVRGNGVMTVVVATALTVMFAVASWHLIEKRVLGLRTSLPVRWFPRQRVIVPIEPEQRGPIDGESPNQSGERLRPDQSGIGLGAFHSKS